MDAVSTLHLSIIDIASHCISDTIDNSSWRFDNLTLINSFHVTFPYFISPSTLTTVSVLVFNVVHWAREQRTLNLCFTKKRDNNIINNHFKLKSICEKITCCFFSIVTLWKYSQQIGTSYNGEFGRSGDAFWILDEIKKENKQLYGFTQSNCAKLHERVISVYLSYAFVLWFSLKSEGCHNVWWRTLLEPWEQPIPTPHFCLNKSLVFLFF